MRGRHCSPYGEPQGGATCNRYPRSRPPKDPITSTRTHAALAGQIVVVAFVILALIIGLSELPDDPSTDTEQPIVPTSESPLELMV